MTRLLVVLTLLVVTLGSAAAHGFLVLGTLTSNPTTPRPGEPFTVTLELIDPTQVPIEDARVRAEFRPAEDAPPVASSRFEETAPGVYRTQVTLPEAGDYQLRLRDQTYREEARATLSFGVGENANPERFEFVFPPTATGANLGTWLLFLVGLPLLAGVLMTVLVLRSTKDLKAKGGRA